MWNFTTTGFTSAVEYDPPLTKYDPKTKTYVDSGEPDPMLEHLPADYQPATDTALSSHLLIRARVKEDLAELQKYDVDAYLFEDPKADYTFRLLIRRTAYAEFMYNSAMGINYWSHVKETIEARAPKVIGGRYKALSTIWSACSMWQPLPPYGNLGTTWTSTKEDKKSDPKGSGKASTSADVGAYWTDNGLYVEPGDAEGSESMSLEDVFKNLPAHTQSPYNDEPAYLAPEDWDAMSYVNLDAFATRATMVAQLTEFARESNQDTDIEAAVDDLIEKYGTVDLDGSTVPYNEIWDIIVAFDVNQFVKDNG